MPLAPDERKAIIEKQLKNAFSPTFLEIMDESYRHIGHAGAKGGASHFSLTIIANAFSNVPLIERHRLIYNALKTLIPDEIHALKINARAPRD